MITLTTSGKDLEIAAKMISDGKVIAYPATGVYGFTCNALDKDAMKRVEKIKGRDSAKKFIIMVNRDNAKRYGKINPTAEKIIDKYWPGLVSIIVEKKGTIPDYITKENVCLSALNDITEFLTRRLELPLITTSANFSGEEACTKPEEIGEKFSKLVDGRIVQEGKLKGKPSTIVDTTTTPYSVVRQGHVEVKV